MKKRTFAVDIDGSITENGGGRIHLDALEALRCLTHMGHDVIFVTGRSSVEGYLLSVFGGTTKIAVGENGGCITLDSNDHILLGDLLVCKDALLVLQGEIENVCEKYVFPRMTEVVLERTFDLVAAKKILLEKGISIQLSDSRYAYPLNSPRINKATGFGKVMERMSILRDDVITIGDSVTDIPLFGMTKTSIALGNASEHVKSAATMMMSAGAGDGVLEALDKLAPKLSEL